jgi:hypothetical protein
VVVVLSITLMTVPLSTVGTADKPGNTPSETPTPERTEPERMSSPKFSESLENRLETIRGEGESVTATTETAAGTTETQIRRGVYPSDRPVAVLVRTGSDRELESPRRGRRPRNSAV